MCNRILNPELNTPVSEKEWNDAARELRLNDEGGVQNSNIDNYYAHDYQVISPFQNDSSTTFQGTPEEYQILQKKGM